MQLGRITLYFIKNKNITNYDLRYTLAIHKKISNKQNKKIELRTFGISYIQYGTRIRIFFLTRKQVLIKAE